MTDFQTEPTIGDTYVAIMAAIRAKDDALAKMDFTGITNLPTGTIRINASNSYKPERWNGTSWDVLSWVSTIDTHIANSSIHEPVHVGSLEIIAYGSPDTGYLLCNGAAVSRTTYSSLFAKIGTTYGAGDGSTTFNIPDLRSRLPIGLHGSVTALNALGKTAGSWDHSHTLNDHSHTVPSHSHDMGNHTHNAPNHSHTIPDHVHMTQGHYHYATANGGDINIVSSGEHTHTFPSKEGGSDGSGANRAQGASSTTGTNQNYTTGTSGSGHVHPKTHIHGTVGQGAGYNGDGEFPTSGPVGSLTTSSNGAAATDGPSTNTTSSVSLTTNPGAGGTSTNASNPPVIALNFQIKF